MSQGRKTSEDPSLEWHALALAGSRCSADRLAHQRIAVGLKEDIGLAEELHSRLAGLVVGLPVVQNMVSNNVEDDHAIKLRVRIDEHSQRRHIDSAEDMMDSGRAGCKAEGCVRREELDLDSRLPSVIAEEAVVGANIVTVHSQAEAHHNLRVQETMDNLSFRLAGMVLCWVHLLHRRQGATREASRC